MKKFLIRLFTPIILLLIGGVLVVWFAVFLLPTAIVALLYWIITGYYTEHIFDWCFLPGHLWYLWENNLLLK